jgi:tetratricopeptide (TPR) repeat protein
MEASDRTMKTFVFAVVLALVGSAAQAQVLVAGSRGTPESDLTPEQEQRLLAEYWTIAKRYVAEPANATKELSAWTRDRVGKVQSIQFQPEQTRPDYLEGKAEWKPETLRAAAMLHSDIALDLARQHKFDDFEFQVGIADGWLNLADNRASTPGSLRARWNVSIARLLLASGQPGLAERHIERVNTRIPGDASILLVYGTIRETQAYLMMASASGSKIEEPAFATRPRNAALTAAATCLERALTIDPSLVEAKLRLAHVHIMKRDDGRAEALLKETLASTPPPVMKYLALLMAGGAQERRRDMQSAAKSYLDAVQTIPNNQTAYIALSSLMHRLNQRADAATVLERMLLRDGADSVSDPWWKYPLGLDLAIDARFEEYRAAVRK